jgi:2-polyprenyl-3-methyl-5-hydroxy-6-metoxy-1,4-benzoquinol methylase
VFVHALTNYSRRGWRRGRKHAARLGAQSGDIMRAAQRESAAMVGRAFDWFAATRNCPTCNDRRIKHDLAVCRTYRDRLGVPRAVTCAGCEGCGALFASPQPSAAAVAALYSDRGEWASAHAVRSSIRKDGPVVRLLDHYVGLARPRGTASVLDVGCGGGRWLNTFADAGWRTFGIEPSTKVAFTHHRELATIPQEPAFEVIILHHVLEHVRKPGDMLQQCTGALRPDGWLFVSVPNLSGLPHHRDWHYCLNGKAHLSAYTHEALQHAFVRAGLRWHCCLDDPRAVVELREGSARTRVLARKIADRPGVMALPPQPLRAALAALEGGGVLR